MAFRWNVAAAFLLSLASASPALAQQRPDRNCADDNGVDRCAAEQQARQRATFGLGPIEAHRDAGEQVRRTFYVDGYGRDLVAIAFVRTPGRDPRVQVHFPRRDGEAAPAPLEASVPQPVWDDILFRSAFFDRALAPAAADPEAVAICLHSWIYTVEATDPAPAPGQPATSRRVTQDACRHGLAQFYAIEMERAALPLFPACARLESRQHRNEAAQLAACRLLRGDRMAAAEVMNRADAFRRLRGADDTGYLAGIFAPGSSIDWNGLRYRGADAAAFWISKSAEGGNARFYPEAIEGLSDRRVRVTGVVARTVDAPGQRSIIYRARVEQIWAFGPAREFQIQSATVGPFEAAPQASLGAGASPAS
jgi:hypothetical protein